MQLYLAKVKGVQLLQGRIKKRMKNRGLLGVSHKASGVQTQR